MQSQNKKKDGVRMHMLGKQWRHILSEQ